MHLLPCKDKGGMVLHAQRTRGSGADDDDVTLRILIQVLRVGVPCWVQIQNWQLAKTSMSSDTS